MITYTYTVTRIHNIRMLSDNQIGTRNFHDDDFFFHKNNTKWKYTLSIVCHILMKNKKKNNVKKTQTFSIRFMSKLQDLFFLDIFIHISYASPP